MNGVLEMRDFGPKNAATRCVLGAGVRMRPIHRIGIVVKNVTRGE